MRPLIVLVETNPWAMVIGADSPRLALYNDGLVIYRQENQFRFVQLDETEAASLLPGNVGSLACFLGNYGNRSITDQPENNLFIGRGGNLSLISVYGSMASAQEDASVPQPLLSAYQRLFAFRHPNARPWLPERIEVMVWPYEYAPEPSIVWPQGWPTIESESTVQRGESYSIFLPSSEYPRLVEFLRERRERGAVEISGRKWAVSIRFPFPSETMWMDLERE